MDTGSKLRELLPHEKGDTERAEAIVALGYPAVAPILPDLIEWLQDCNWPVAHVLSPFLAQIGLPLLPPVRAVLATNDYQWKYWVLLSSAQCGDEHILRVERGGDQQFL